MIDKTTFEQAQQILARRCKDATLRRGNPTPFLLSGLVRCQHCGRAYVGTSAHGRNARYTYYACSTRYKYGRARCDGQRLSKDRLERAVLAQLATIYRDGQLINDALTQAAEQASTDRPLLYQGTLARFDANDPAYMEIDGRPVQAARITYLAGDKEGLGDLVPRMALEAAESN